MNYLRIYRQFIDDRRVSPVADDVYAEKHHITPRALGGGNEPENLIRLVPEDHFFAHLLLAKIHGGKMWAPLAFMCAEAGRNRRKYGWAVRAMARACSGKGSHQFDHTVYTLVHKDGQQWNGRRADMRAIGISLSMACMLISGVCKSAKGWGFQGVDGGRKSGAGHPGYKQEVFTLNHVDGRQVVGTRLKLHSDFGFSRSGLSRLLSGQAVVWNGWHKPGGCIAKNGARRTLDSGVNELVKHANHSFQARSKKRSLDRETPARSRRTACRKACQVEPKATGVA